MFVSFQAKAATFLSSFPEDSPSNEMAVNLEFGSNQLTIFPLAPRSQHARQRLHIVLNQSIDFEMQGKYWRWLLLTGFKLKDPQKLRTGRWVGWVVEGRGQETGADAVL